MTKYQKAALLFGKDGSAGESDAIANYLGFMNDMYEKGDPKTLEDKMAMDNVLERIGDELNHLLGDTLDAINMAGLKISPDGIDEIFEGLRKAVDKEDIQVTVNINTPEVATDVNLNYPINL